MRGRVRELAARHGVQPRGFVVRHRVVGRRCPDGAGQANRVSEKMGHVREAIRRVADIVAEISAASDEPARGIEQINQAVTQMDALTQQNAALVEQAAAAAQSLDEQPAALGDAGCSA
ncbi:hypothetical protein Bpla01_64760 [Burkholderia plantarii]|nr:hypothetical protein Bpla01_64760 [Burkholderia plantarii]